MAADDSRLEALLAEVEAIRTKPQKAGSLREDVDQLARTVQALAAEIANLKRQLHRVSAIGRPLPRPSSNDK